MWRKHRFALTFSRLANFWSFSAWLFFEIKSLIQTNYFPVFLPVRIMFHSLILLVVITLPITPNRTESLHIPTQTKYKSLHFKYCTLNRLLFVSVLIENRKTLSMFIILKKTKKKIKPKLCLMQRIESLELIWFFYFLVNILNGTFTYMHASVKTRGHLN